MTDNIDVLTKGILAPGNKWDWHKHEQYDELGIVLKGKGKFYWEDVIIIPANTTHKFEAEGNEISEFYFVRIKV